jgi:hypothetical protein
MMRLTVKRLPDLSCRWPPRSYRSRLSFEPPVKRLLCSWLARTILSSDYQGCNVRPRVTNIEHRNHQRAKNTNMGELGPAPKDSLECSINRNQCFKNPVTTRYSTADGMHKVCIVNILFDTHYHRASRLPNNAHAMRWFPYFL